jgi:hypothetical protein
MKTFTQFCNEAYDADVMKSSQIRRTGEGGRVGAERKKTAPEMRRLKQAKAGQERTPTSYKPRKDIGTQKQVSTRVQQPTQERGSAALSPKEAQRKAYLERKARESGKAQATSASELLKKKKSDAVDKRPSSQPKRPLVGMSRKQRQEITRKGQEKLEKLVRQSEAEKQGKRPEEVKLTGGKEGKAETEKTGKPYKYRSW